MRSILVQALLAIGVVAVSLSESSAATINFESAAAVQLSYSEAGFIVTASSSVYTSGEYGNPGRSTSLELAVPSLVIKSGSNSPFNLLSLDRLCLNFSDRCSDVFSVSGKIVGGGTVAGSIAASDNWQTSTFAGFTDLTELTLTFESGRLLFIDNIVLSEVPLPAALPLLASGIAGLGWLRRRQRLAA